MRTESSQVLGSSLLCIWTLGIAVLLLHTTLGATQEVTAGSTAKAGLPPLESLQLHETTVFASAPPNAMRAGTQCDSSGDAFVQFANLAGSPLQVAQPLSVSEVIPEEKRVVVYGAAPLSESDYPHARTTSFGLLPDGKLYALIFTRQDQTREEARPQPQYYVEQFKDDGTKDSITPIHTPPGAAHWFADLLAPFPDGNFLIVGTSMATAKRPSAGSWRPFTAVYDATGQFVRDVTLPDDITNDFNQSSTGRPRVAAADAQTPPRQTPKPQQFFEVAITTGGVLSGPDGNVWILRASDPVRLYAVSSVGRVVEHFEFSPPAPGLTPFDFGFASSGQVFLDFSPPPGTAAPPRSGPSEMVAVFNILSHQFDALYTLPDETNKGIDALACSDGNGGFLYIGGTPDNHLAVFDYAPR